MNRLRWIRLLLAALVGATSMTLVVGPSHATPADPPPAAAPRVAKPTPPPPPDAVDVAKGPRIVPKPKLAPGAQARPLAAWTVTMTTSNNFPWPTTYTTLTATANQDVGPTPYYLSIYDSNAYGFIAICGTGTTCTASVTRPKSGYNSFVAYVSEYPNTVPHPPNVQASTLLDPTRVWFRGMHVELSPSPSTLFTGATTTLTATVTRDDWTDPVDIGPSPFFIGIYDVATGTRLAMCGSGSTCGIPVSQSVYGTRRYVAYVSENNAAYPPTGIQATSTFAYATWVDTWRGQRQVSLQVERMTNAYVHITATTDPELDSSIPYYVEIFDNVTNRPVAICGSGTTCSTVWKLYQRDTGWHSFVAFVTWHSATIPDSPIASSNVADSLYPGSAQHPVP